MATSVDFIEFVYESVKKYGFARYKKMFGEYMVYIDEKPVFLVCDNTVYIKKHAGIEQLMADSDVGHPYNGAKEHYILDIENANLLDCIIPMLVQLTPFPKEKKKK